MFSRAHALVELQLPVYGSGNSAHLLYCIGTHCTQWETALGTIGMPTATTR
jgi:hypothetical protein